MNSNHCLVHDAIDTEALGNSYAQYQVLLLSIGWHILWCSNSHHCQWQSSWKISNWCERL